MKKIFYLLIISNFIFLLSICCVLAQNSDTDSLKENATDEEWFNYMQVHGFNIMGMDEKMPMLAKELNLSPNDQQEIEQLFSDYSDEDVLRRAVSDEYDIEYKTNGNLKTNLTAAASLNQQALDAHQDTISDIKTVRQLLGNKDLEFRLWLFTDGIIWAKENKAYRKNHNYSNDELVGDLFKNIQSSSMFRAFKAEKMEELGSTVNVDKYMLNYKASLKERLLFQRKREGHQSDLTR
jgi:hypothetical protein